MVAVTAILAGATSSICSALNIIDKISDQLNKVKNQELISSVLELQKMFVKIQRDHIKLETEIAKLSSENDRLEGALTNKQALPQADGLSEEEVSILRMLYSLSEGQQTVLFDITRRLDIKEQRCKYFLERLEGKELIYVARFYNGEPNRHSIASEGRAYIIENDLA